MRPLRLSGALQVAEGNTTLQEVMAATPGLDMPNQGQPSAALDA
jgi:hypothetical protein